MLSQSALDMPSRPSENYSSSHDMSRMRSQPTQPSYYLGLDRPFSCEPVSNRKISLPSISELVHGPRSALPSVFGSTYNTTTPQSNMIRLPPLSAILGDSPKSISSVLPSSKKMQVHPVPQSTEEFKTSSPTAYSTEPTQLSDQITLPTWTSRRYPQLGLANDHVVFADMVRCTSMPPELPNIQHGLRRRSAVSAAAYTKSRCLTPEIGVQDYSSDGSETFTFPQGRKRCASEAPALPASGTKRGRKARPRFQFVANLTPEKCSLMHKDSPSKRPTGNPKSTSHSPTSTGSNSSSNNRSERPRRFSDAKPRRESTPPPISYAPSWRIPILN
ncbi:hypothetical protein IWQ61_005069, partial [Dispira simplex]